MSHGRCVDYVYCILKSDVVSAVVLTACAYVLCIQVYVGLCCIILTYEFLIAILEQQLTSMPAWLLAAVLFLDPLLVGDV